MTFPPALRTIAALACLGSALAASAQPAEAEPEAWREAEVRLPERIDLDSVVTFSLGTPSGMTFGIEPASLRVDADGVVRYAFVARSSSGATNVLFEGIRCQTGEVKLYASWDAGQGWTPVSGSAWQPLSFRGPTRRPMQMARGGVCSHRTPNGTPALILDTLRNGTPDLSR